jgi:hypothetical protein
MCTLALSHHAAMSDTGGMRASAPHDALLPARALLQTWTVGGLLTTRPPSHVVVRARQAVLRMRAGRHAFLTRARADDTRRRLNRLGAGCA